MWALVNRLLNAVQATAWAGWALVVVFGLTGVWTPQLCGTMCALAMVMFLVVRYARRLGL